MFSELYEQGKALEKNQAQYGMALTLFAAIKRCYPLDKENLDKIKTCLRRLNIDDSYWDNYVANFYLNSAEKLIKQVLREQPFNYSAILYLFLIGGNGSLPRKASDENEINSLLLLIRYLKQEIPDSLNIRANYFVVEALAYYALGNSDQKNICELLFYAKKTAEIYKNSCGNRATIFSDIQIKQIDVDEFLKEIGSIKNEIRTKSNGAISCDR